MFFQGLDNKQECVALYYDDKLYYDIINLKLYSGTLHTWNYSQYLKNFNNIEYASLYCGGASLREMCPDSLKEQYDKIERKLNAYKVSFREAKIDLNEICIYELIPEDTLLECCKIKNQICNYIFDNFERPKNYDFLVSLLKMSTDISLQKLNIAGYNDPYINYNIFGTVTGRLATKKNSFSILSMKKEKRNLIRPTNSYFLDLDYNAFEIRVLLALLGKEQPNEDLHEWHKINVFNYKVDNFVTRDDIKREFFHWLYNPEYKNELLDQLYDRKSIKEKYWDGEKIKTIFGREIVCDDWHAFNYIVSSTAADLFLRQAIKVYEFLKDKKSFISFLLHDRIVVDIDREEKNIMKEIINIYKNTELGEIRTNIYVGNDFNNMRLVG